MQITTVIIIKVCYCLYEMQVSKKRKFEKDVRASEQKKMKKSDKKEAVEK